MTAFEVYFPVPMMRREANARPAMVNAESATGECLPPTNEVDHFYAVTFGHHDGWKCVPLENGQVVFHGNAAWVDVERAQQLNDRH